MNPDRLRRLLERVRRGETAVDDAVRELEALPFQDLGVVKLDHHRSLRHGCPEVIYGEGKTTAQLEIIVDNLLQAGQNVLVTRLDADKAAALKRRFVDLEYADCARVARLEPVAPASRPCGPVAVVSAGTSDLPVAEEAGETLAALGLEPMPIYDVGVAGIHRLLDRIDQLRRASAAIVVAGMEGALPSVVGGIVSCPLVAVPASVGYGTALGGFTALLAMLSSCAPGVVVVNIDNGFGAAMAVHRMLPRAKPRSDGHGL